MGKKNWIEFNNHENNHIEKSKVKNLKKLSKINISKQKKGKKGKTITLVKGLGIENESQIKEMLRKIKVFCCTGGIVIGNDIQLQGDMVNKVIDFLRKEGFQNL